MSEKASSQEITRAISLIANASAQIGEALSILLAAQASQGTSLGSEPLSSSVQKTDQKPSSNILSQVPPFQAKIVRELAKLPKGTATTEELATAMGMTLESFKGFVRGSGRSGIKGAQDILYERGWRNGRRCYTIKQAGKEAVEEINISKQQ